MKQKIKVETKTRVCIYVGYEWQKGVSDCVDDQYWVSIREQFGNQLKSFEKDGLVKIELRRLRASHGRFIWESVLEKIVKADMLVFDVAKRIASGNCGVRETSTAKFNSNVLLELGAAMALKKRVLILCPEKDMKSFPSDLHGLLLTCYKTGRSAGGTFSREFVDSKGLFPQLRAMVRQVVEEKMVEYAEFKGKES